MKGKRIVILKSERSYIKSCIYSSYIDQGSALRRTFECVCWPGMSDDHERKQMIETCETCNSYCAAQLKETVQSTLRKSEFPWQKIGLDLLTVNQKNYHISLCYHTGFCEIDYLRHTIFKAAMNK